MVIKRTFSLIQSIESAVVDVPGWTPLDQLFSLALLALSTRNIDGDFLEVGSWCGRSSIAIGIAASMMDNTCLSCIDLFPTKEDWYQNDDGSYSFSVKINSQRIDAYNLQTVWREPYEKSILPVYEKWHGTLDAFKHFISENNLQSYVKPHKTNLSTFLTQEKDRKIKFAFIDGDHSYEAVSSDINCIKQCLVPGAWICFDDAFSFYKGVDRAITDWIINSKDFSYSQQLTRKLFVAQYRL